MQRQLVPARILVVDADEASARQLELALTDESSVEVVGWAGSAEQAVELAGVSYADVILLAVELPEALDALERLVRIIPKPPKVILMGEETSRLELLASTGEVVGLARRIGEVAGFVRKTGDLSELVTLVIALIALANVPSGEVNGSTLLRPQKSSDSST